jgi:serine/threonine protein kinase
MTPDNRHDHESRQRVDRAVATCLASTRDGAKHVLDALEPHERSEAEELLQALSLALAQMPGPLSEGLLVDDRYELLDELGVGGFGRVWSARDHRVDKDVAIKFIQLPPQSSSSPEEIFEAERQALARVDRPGIARILDCGEFDEMLFLVMDLVPGRTVSDAVTDLRTAHEARGTAPTGEALRDAIGVEVAAGEPDWTAEPSWHRICAQITAELLRALEAVHAVGIVHLDIHPGNIVLRAGGHPVLLDFGLATLRKEGLVPTNAFRGSLPYMDPEQLRQGRSGNDPRSDIYQVGLTLYELLTLRPAFDPGGDDELPMRVIRGAFAAPRGIDASIPRKLEAICLRALANDPAQRPQTATELRKELEVWLQGVAAPPADERFHVLETLAEDPRFIRYRAYDRHYECDVFLEQAGEVLRQELSMDLRDKALREARAISKIQHPNVARLRGELVEFRGIPTLVFEPIEGEGLDAVLEREPCMEPAAVIRLGRELAQAVQALHAANVVHRGIGAESVVLSSEDGHAILRGFTFAKPVADRLSQESLLHHRRIGDAAERGKAPASRAADLALPEYASPEQLRGEPAMPRSDIFALGCLLYRCATGVEARSEYQLDYQPPTPADKINRAVPRSLSSLIQKCLASSPTARYPNMAVVDEELAICERAFAPASPTVGPRHLYGLIAITAIVALGAALYVGQLQRDDGFAPRGAYVHPSTSIADNPPVYDTKYTMRRAFLVGSDYRTNTRNAGFAELKNAEADVQRIRDLLAKLGWKPEEVRVCLGEEATRVGILDGLEWACNIESDGQALIYFAGHGELAGWGGSGGYFIPHDGNDRRSSWINLLEVTAPLQSQTGPKHILVALDCCHAGAAIPTLRGESRPARDADEVAPLDRVTSQHVRRRARVLLTSALASEKADDTSPFAAGFASALEEGLSGRPISTSLIYSRIHKAVVDAEATQCCWRTDFHSEATDFVFLPAK